MGHLSQAISAAFYLVGFAEAFEPLFEWLAATHGIALDPRFVSLPATALLVGLVLTRGQTWACRRCGGLSQVTRNGEPLRFG